jgi:DNA-binding GntR family transcriptional regulator
MTRTREKIVPAQLEQRVYERLAEEIVSGALTPGEQLIESKLATAFGVSKTPVREALIRLQRDGLVEIEPYRGARVGEPSARDMVEISELRLLLEGRIVADIAREQPAEVIDTLDAALTAARRAFKSHDSLAVRAALTTFSDSLAAASDNSHLRTMLGGLRNKFMLIGNTSANLPGRHERSIEEHQAILDAIKAGDADGAVAATVDHVRSIERAWLETAGVADAFVDDARDRPRIGSL